MKKRISQTKVPGSKDMPLSISSSEPDEEKVVVESKQAAPDPFFQNLPPDLEYSEHQIFFTGKRNIYPEHQIFRTGKRNEELHQRSYLLGSNVVRTNQTTIPLSQQSNRSSSVSSGTTISQLQHHSH